MSADAFSSIEMASSFVGQHADEIVTDENVLSSEGFGRSRGDLGLRINMPAWAFCMNCYADFEFRGYAARYGSRR